MLHGSDYKLGFTGALGHLETLGKVGWFPDVNYWATFPSSQAALSDGKCKAILVINRSGSTYSPGQIVTWDTANEGPGKATGAVAGAGVAGVGIVDPTLPTGTTVADGEGYYLIVGGPTKVQFSGDSTSIAIGDSISGGYASGRTQLATGGSDSGLIYSNVADSSVFTGNVAADYSVSYTFPANTFKAGDVIRVVAQGTCTATNSTDTLTVLLNLGSVQIATTGAVDNANSDVFGFTASINIRTIGASGTLVGDGTVYSGVPGTVTAKAFTKASATIDTTAANKLALNAVYSTNNAGNTSVLNTLRVFVDRPGAESLYPKYGIALEAVTGGATAGTLYRARVNFEGSSIVY